VSFGRSDISSMCLFANFYVRSDPFLLSKKMWGSVSFSTSDILSICHFAKGQGKSMYTLSANANVLSVTPRLLVTH
jgi:hypothetical protein